MICQTARDWLTHADSPVRLADAPPDVAAHIHGCRGCQQAMGKIARLDQAWRGLPLPDGASAAKAKFLERTLNRPRHPLARRPSSWRRLVPVGVAATVALGISLCLGVWLLAPVPKTQPPTSLARAGSEAVIDKLIDWNLQLTESNDPRERARLFRERADALKDNFVKSDMTEDDRQLAQTLFDNGEWLTTNEDSLEAADRFAAVADRLLTRMQTAASSNDAQATVLTLQNYERVSARGIDAKLDQVKATDGERQTRVEKIQARDARRIEALEQLHTKIPDASKKELKRVIEQAKKPKPKHHGKK